MRNSNRLAALVLSALALVTACEDDPVQPAADRSEYLPLTTRDAVLSNLETAWNKRATDRIDDLLDDNFIFFFAPGDVWAGLPVQWSRADEIGATKALFTSNTVANPVGPVCTSVRLDLNLEEVTWEPIAPPTIALGEAWYTATVYYDFTFTMKPDDTLNSGVGAQAQLTVREVAVGTGTEWRLVEWRDLDNSLAAAANQPAGASESKSVTELVASKTWGEIKALYRNFVSLPTRDAVLSNLEVAWNGRSTNMVDQLLDDNFTFFFSDGDVGGQIPAQWGRADELQTNHDLFVSNSQPVPNGPVCKSIRLDISADNLQWFEIIPASYPDEIWYLTTTFYTYSSEMEPDQSYVAPPGAKAEFTVRNVGTNAAPHWQLVEWRDLGSSYVAGAEQITGTTEATWGAIKALYH